LGCDAEIIPIVLNGHGEALDVGREQRLATRAQRRALRAMYRTCAYPGCHISIEACRIHHVHWWNHDGPTSLHNLIPLCSSHHHLVHEGGWTLTLTPDRTITLTRPDGTVHFHGATNDRTARSEPPTTADDPSLRLDESEIANHLRREAEQRRGAHAEQARATEPLHVAETTPGRGRPPPRVPAA
jgi:hypothetical protein